MTLRPVGPADEQLLLSVYASTRADELAPVPWTDEQRADFVAAQFAAQTAHYAKQYTGMTADVVLVEGAPAGRLLVERWPEEIRIVDITLLPAFRGRGVGTRLLEALQKEASEAGKSLTIHVEVHNPARSLYDRLGFRQVKDLGVYLLMRWTAPDENPRQEG